MSDDELAEIEAEIFGSDDIEEVICTFLDDCVGNVVCEILAHGLLVLDPIPSRPLSNSTQVNLVPALGITKEVPAAAMRSLTSGGAVHEVLGAHVYQALGTGDVDLPASNFTFEWDAGPPAPAVDSNPPVVHGSAASVDSVCDGDATCGSRVVLDMRTTQARLCSL